MHKILIVDDEKKSRDYLSELIRSILPDAVITQANYPLTALELIRKYDYDLLFSDIVMPRMDGLEMIGKIIECEKKPYIVLISAHDKFEYARKGMELGASGYILKPFSKEHVARIIENYLEKTGNSNEIQIILLEKGFERFPLKIKDIVAFERVDRFRMHVFTKTDRFQYINGTFPEMMSQLPGYFLRINRQCIINMKSISRFNQRSREIFLMQNDSELVYICSRENVKQLNMLFHK